MNQSQEAASVTAITISHLLVGLFPSTLHWLKWLFIPCSLVLYDFCFSFKQLPDEEGIVDNMTICPYWRVPGH